MLTRWRSNYERTSISFGKASLKIGLKPDFWTYFSLAAAFVSALLIWDGQFIAGLVLMIVMNVADMMDGAAARAGNTCSPFGTVFDHTVDRYAEFVVLAGFMAGGWVSPLLGIFTATGVVMASYVRAKAESLSNLKLGAVGFAGREEKLLLMMASLLVFSLDLSLAGKVLIFLVGLVSHITVLQRLLFTRQKMVTS